MTTSHNDTGGAWQADAWKALQGGGIDLIAYVPDAGHTITIKATHADPNTIAVPCTTEEEGIAIAAGAHLGGKRAAMLMQSSGVGNCINMLSLIETCRFPFLALVTMRGEWAEFNPWQNPMGQATETVLEAMNVTCKRADRPGDVSGMIGAAIDQVFHGDQAMAIILGQRLVGRKVWK